MKKFTPTTEMVATGLAVVMAMAHLQLVGPVVRAYRLKILKEGQWMVRPEYAERLDREIITDIRDDFLMTDADFAEYDARCKTARDEAKLFVSDPECCPLLVAEARLVAAENEMITAMSSITNIRADQVLSLGLGQRKEFIDLTLRLLAPFLHSPL